MSEFTVISGVSHLQSIQFLPGDQVSWTPSTTEPTTLTYTPEFSSEQPWTAEMKWVQDNVYAGTPSFDTADSMTVEIGKDNQLTAQIFGAAGGKMGDGELGSWTADEDPDAEEKSVPKAPASASVDASPPAEHRVRGSVHSESRHQRLGLSLSGLLLFLALAALAVRFLP